jgi:hypothetical protein
MAQRIVSQTELSFLSVLEQIALWLLKFGIPQCAFGSEVPVPAIASLEDLKSARKYLLGAKDLADEILIGNGHLTGGETDCRFEYRKRMVPSL